jgi:hypothetical protein
MMTHKEMEKDQEWRKLCELVAHEQDPRRLSALVDQLVKMLDARRQALRTADQWLSPTEPKND